MANRTLSMTEALYDYYLGMNLRENSILRRIRRETQKLPSSKNQIAPEQGQFMAFLLKLMGARRVLEVGTYTGYSATVMAQALPSNGTLITCDINADWTQYAQTFWQEAGVAHKIQLRLGPAIETLALLSEQNFKNYFDFVFIDANKSQMKAYYEQALLLVRSGGVIALDNVFKKGEVADVTIQNSSTRAIRELNEYLFQDERIDLSVVPIADGLTLARKR